MTLRKNRFLFQAAAWGLMGAAGVYGQTQDVSGNALLKGNFRFRHVAVQTVDSNGNPTQVTASYGLIVFDGAGNYKITGTSVDNTASNGAPTALSVSGTYAIGSNGLGYIANPLYPTDSNDNEYGAVSQGVFAGSATEAEAEGYVLNDIFVAIPVGATAPTTAGFTSAYQTALLDFTAAGSAAVKNALFKMTGDGKGGLGSISLSGQAANQTASSLTQTVAGATYAFASDGTATLTVPLPTGVTSTNALFTGSKTMFQSADGNFILGWTATGYDIFVGVKAISNGTNALTKGLYFTAGLEDGPTASGVDSFYGGLSNAGNANGDGIEHARLNYPNYNSYDFGTDDQITLNADGTSNGTDFNGYQYAFGVGGQAFVAIGTQGYFSLIVGLHAASFSGKGVYLNPIGVANAASFQPITASLAPGELITLFGTNLAATTQTTSGGVKFPTTLGGVSVTIDSIPCPIYYVSATQLAVIVPYALSQNTTGLADIQVTNNGTLSNVVQMYFSDTAPGSFSQSANGLGLASALHATTGQLVTSANPAQGGEYISLYLTGLGTVTPPITDGSLGPASTLSLADVNTAGNLSVYFNDYGSNGTTGNAGTIQFAGLAPNLAGLYQINVQVPKTGLASGDNVYVELVTDYADVNQIQIPYGSSGSTAVRPVRGAAALSVRAAARPESMKVGSAKHVNRPGRGAASQVCSTVETTGVRSTCIRK